MVSSVKGFWYLKGKGLKSKQKMAVDSGEHHRSIVPEGTTFLVHQYCTMQDPGLDKKIDVTFPQHPTWNLTAL